MVNQHVIFEKRLEKNVNDRQNRKILTFDDDYSDDDNDPDKSLEAVSLENQIVNIPGANHKNSGRSGKRFLSNSRSSTSHENNCKRSYNKSIPSKDNENEEILMFLKSSLLANADLSKDVNRSTKDLKHLIVSVEKLDAKMNILYENQKKIWFLLVKMN